MRRGDGDDWLRATLLGAAFRAGDVAKTDELAAKVEDEGAAAWRLDTTLRDARIAVAQLKDAEVQAIAAGHHRAAHARESDAGRKTGMTSVHYHKRGGVPALQPLRT